MIIHEEAEIVGFLKRIKDRLNKFLEELARENEKSFGGGRLDCCNLNGKTGIKDPVRHENSRKESQ